MPKFIHLTADHLRHGRVVHYKAGDVLTIAFKRTITGFGVRFAPLQSHQSWNLRSVNSSVGLNTYAPSQAFTLDGIHLEFVSPGDEGLEIVPHRSGKQLIVHATHEGILQRSTRAHKSYAPPQWAYDFWFTTSWTRMSRENVTTDIAEAKQHHLAPRVWLLDAGWSSDASYLDFNKRRFADGNNFLTTLRDQQIQPIVWMAPYITVKTRNWEQFHANGWFVKDVHGNSMVFAVTGDNLQFGSYIDYTNESLLQFLQQKITALHQAGLRGIMFDFGESLPDGAVFQNSSPAVNIHAQRSLQGHNWYVGEAKRALHQIVRQFDLCLISRSGWTDTYTHSGLWLGDQSSDMSRFAGLGSLTWGYKTAYEAGYNFVGMDIGGYFGFPSPHDYKRWLDLAVTMPFAMLHGAYRNDPWDEGSEVLSHFRKRREQHNQIWQNPTKIIPEFTVSSNTLKIEKIHVASFTFNNTNVN